MLNTDTRSLSIRHWLTHTLKLDISQFEPASSDASFRRYFRVIHQNGQHIVMDAPPEKEDTAPFIRVAKLFKASQVNVPEIYQQEKEQGFLLLEDFGSQCLLDHLNKENVQPFYQSAFNILHTLQKNTSITNSQLPHYDKALLQRETALFYDWFLQKTLNITLPKDLKSALNDTLVDSALAQPQVCVHRDFHSRNLMVLDDQSLGVIDFQDAVIGPITYDLVSLLRDCYVAWPAEDVYQWVRLFYQQAQQAGLVQKDLKTFKRQFDLMGLQRHLKAIGIFSRLNLRDNKPSYLNDIPRTMAYVSQICQQYPELSAFNHFLTNTVLPAYNHT
ncbi:MAG: phosphotransferase [Methylococcales bacterium]|nr:phosphotransferase [Methylococcales bacterium]